jgi:hypothetical protein
MRMTRAIALVATPLVAIAGLAGCATEVTDTAAPAAVADLEATFLDPSSITLTWTAPGDDGSEGTAATYDVRYSTDPFTEQDWNQLTQVANEPVPLAAGSAQTLTVTGLTMALAYRFALETSDEAGNTSPISNIATAELPSPAGGWVVDAGGGGQFTTIAAAIVVAADGDTIRIRAGSYDEALTIDARELTFIGEGALGTRIRYSGLVPNQPVLTVTGASVLSFSALMISQDFINCGAGLRCGPAADVTFEDCALLGCGIDTDGARLVARRCTVWALPPMTCDMLVPIVKLHDGEAVFEQCIVGGAPYFTCGGEIASSFSCNDFWQCRFAVGACPDPIGANGNIARDPLFVDPEGPTGDFRLLPDSPCREGGTGGCGRMGVFGDAP